MGMFDTYGDIQLKVGIPDLRVYRIGDKVSIPDGVYFDDADYEGAVIIKDHKLLWTTYDVWDNFGQRLSP